MRRALVLAALLAVGGTQSAAAATLVTNQTCYAEREQVLALGQQFSPGAAAAAFLNGTQFGQGTVDPQGAIGLQLAAPRLRRGLGERAHRLTVNDAAGNTATTRFGVSEFSADFSPSSGNPNTLRSRFELFGFGARRTIYMHYIAPDGRQRLARRLGRTGGTCGFLRTGRLKLFPFDAERGTWRFQWDTSRRYRRNARPRIVQRFRIRLVPASATGVPGASSAAR